MPALRTAHPDPGGAAVAAGKRAGKDRALQGTTVTRTEPPHRDELIYERTAEARVLRIFRPGVPRSKAGVDPQAGGSLRGPCRPWRARITNKLYEADRAPAREGVGAAINVPEHPAERPRRLQPGLDAGHHDHRRPC